MTFKCNFCGALGFQSEVKTTPTGEYHFGDLCCRKGEIKIRNLPSIPSKLQYLFDPTNDDAKFFCKTLESSILECQWLLFNSVICHSKVVV